MSRSVKARFTSSPTFKFSAFLTFALSAMKCVPSPMGMSEESHLVSPKVIEMGINPRILRPRAVSAKSIGTRM